MILGLLLSAPSHVHRRVRALAGRRTVEAWTAGHRKPVPWTWADYGARLLGLALVITTSCLLYITYCFRADEPLREILQIVVCSDCYQCARLSSVSRNPHQPHHPLMTATP